MKTIPRARAKVAKDVFELIGNTPLLRFRKLVAPFAPVEIYAKAEWYNPGGSVKDRPAREIILTAEREGRLHPGKIILDATSGNMGIAYAMLGAARGYRVTLCIPANASPERLRILRAYGAELILTDPLEGTDGAILEARRRYEADPKRYFYADQYNNPANWKAHYRTTGPEIWEQTEGRITHFVAGLGTSGTMMGVGRYLKERNPAIRLIGVQPDGPFHGLEGLKHMETAIQPGIYDPGLLDEILTISTEEAYAAARRLAREEGVFVGISSGAAMAAALKVAARLREGMVVTIFPDAGYKYLSENFWFEEDR
ncbi:MAG: cysteine synthase family protein [Thermoflexus sp.]|nr:cysteine synthase family protein [Thermoflexus sp.]MCS7351463.1 cysteine synthase family protein [Thermoflexus sp.]